MSVEYNREMIFRAKLLRKNMTKEEKHLWYDFLRGFSLPIQRQKTISSFIVDFYCHKAKLAIEVDGLQHITDDGIRYDQERSAILERYGIEVLRINNRKINNHFQSVCAYIEKKLYERATYFKSQEY